MRATWASGIEPLRRGDDAGRLEGPEVAALEVHQFMHQGIAAFGSFIILFKPHGQKDDRLGQARNEGAAAEQAGADIWHALDDQAVSRYALCFSERWRASAGSESAWIRLEELALLIQRATKPEDHPGEPDTRQDQGCLGQDGL